MQLDLDKIVLDDAVWDINTGISDVSRKVAGARFLGRYAVDRILERTPEFLLLFVRDIYTAEESWIKFYRLVPGKISSEGNLNVTHDRALYECYMLSALSASGSEVPCAPRLRSFAAPPQHVAYAITEAFPNSHRLSEELAAPMSVFRQAVLGSAILAAVTDAWSRKQVILGDLRPANVLVLGDPAEGKKSWIPVRKDLRNIRIKVLSWRNADLPEMPQGLSREAEFPLLQKALDTLEHRQWAKSRIEDHKSLWNSQHRDAILRNLEDRPPAITDFLVAHGHDLFMASSTLALLAARPSATSSSSSPPPHKERTSSPARTLKHEDVPPSSSRLLKHESEFHAAAERWITAGLPKTTNLYQRLLDETSRFQPGKLADSPFRAVLSQKWECASDFAEAWHDVVPWQSLPERFLTSAPLTPATWLLDPSDTEWTAAHFWRILDVLESPAGADVRQLFLPINAFGKTASDSLRRALHDLNVLARRRKMSVMWQNKNLAALDVRVRGDDLGESVALLVSQGSTSFAVQGSIKSAAAFAKALPSCSTLLSLDLTDCFLFDEGCVLVAQALTNTLRHLNLTKNGLTCTAVSNLATLIVPSLHSLSLSQNAIGVNGILALALAVAKAPALIALDLSSNCIASGLVYIGRAMAKDGGAFSQRVRPQLLRRGVNVR